MATDLHALAVNKLNRRLIRKGRKVAVLIADMDIAVPDVITEAASITDAPALKALTGFYGLGLLDKGSALTTARAREKAETMAIGFQDSVRSDYTSDKTNIKCLGLEMNRWTIEQHLGVDLTDVPLKAKTGELAFPQPVDGDVRQNRVMSIAQDRNQYGLYWWARCLLAGENNSDEEQTVGNDEDPLGWPMDFQSSADTDAGYSVRHYFGGPGWRAALDEMGFEAITA